MSQTIQEKNKALVLDAFDTLFNKRDYAAAEKYWSPDYIQHSAHIEPGRDGLFNLIRSAPDTLRYEHQLIVADGITSLSTDVFQETAGLLPGSPRILSGSRMAASPSIGMSCKMRRAKPNRRAACRCLVRRFQLTLETSAIRDFATSRRRLELNFASMSCSSY